MFFFNFFNFLNNDEIDIDGDIIMKNTIQYDVDGDVIMD